MGRRQADKDDLIQIAQRIGAKFDKRGTVQSIRIAIFARLDVIYPIIESHDWKKRNERKST